MKLFILSVAMLGFSVSGFAASVQRTLTCENTWTIETTPRFMIRYAGQYGDLNPSEQYKNSPTFETVVDRDTRYLPLSARNDAGQMLSISCPGLDLSISQDQYSGTCLVAYDNKRPGKIGCMEIR